MRGDALQTFKNITILNIENLGEILTVFRRKYVNYSKTQNSTTGLQSSETEVNRFSRGTPESSENAFGVAAQAIIVQVMYAKMPPHLEKSINGAHLENGT